MAPASPIPVSVVVPAHNESAVIARCLQSLTHGAEPGEVELVVVCNGCTDATAAIARQAAPGARVLELDRASKSAALNAGDAAATRFPRFYVDADVTLGIDALRATAAMLAAPDAPVLCAAPRPTFVLDDRRWPIRAFYETWDRMPYLNDNVVGSGVYALSQRGRARFGAFPEIVADDQFVLEQFDAGERRNPAGHGFSVFPPTTLGGLVRIRRRAYRGARELARQSAVPASPRSGRAQAAYRVAADPRRIPALAVYFGVAAAARLAVRATSVRAWERDDSARERAAVEHHAVEHPADATTATGDGVAYVVSAYPAVSHVFIQREVAALRASGTRVDVFSVHRADAAVALSDADVSERARTTSILPARARVVMGAHARVALRFPRAYAATFRYALAQSPPGARARLWQVFYFAEAVIVWAACRARGLRHLHAHFANVGADIAWLAAYLGRQAEPADGWRWTFTMHGCLEFFAVERFNLARKVGAAERVLCISDHTRAQLMALSAPEHWSKLDVVHCGVDLTRYRPRPRGQAGTTDPSVTRVLAVGRLSPEKGQLVLLDALARVRAAGHDVRVTLVGDGPLRDEILRETARLGLEEHVVMAGAVGQDEMPGYYGVADVFCQPSFAEGVPVVLMEAMASGLPVVSTSVGGIAELVDDRCSGLLVDPGRPDRLAAALATLAADPAGRERMGRAGRTIVERGFDISTIAVEIQERLGLGRMHAARGPH